ncbi:MAG: hypothetical protein MSG78_03305 [Clostridiales bacterium]|nr:hypothetical protein [Clostridiales bacterium]
MSSKTKIFVFKMREVIYTLIFAALAILLIILLIFMFLPGKDTNTAKETGTYIPGVYTASITLNNQALDVEVSVDANHINAINFVNLNESIATMYPLMETVMNNIQTQVLQKQSTTSITYENDTQYTSMVLLDAVERALNKARAVQDLDSSEP